MPYNRAGANTKRVESDEIMNDQVKIDTRKSSHLDKVRRVISLHEVEDIKCLNSWETGMRFEQNPWNRIIA
jgi:hypothetical protein